MRQDDCDHCQVLKGVKYAIKKAAVILVAQYGLHFCQQFSCFCSVIIGVTSAGEGIKTWRQHDGRGDSPRGRGSSPRGRSQLRRCRIKLHQNKFLPMWHSARGLEETQQQQQQTRVVIGPPWPEEYVHGHTQSIMLMQKSTFLYPAIALVFDGNAVYCP